MDVEATYNDGRTARIHPVRVAAEGGILFVRTADGTELDRWPTGEIRLLNRPGDGQMPRLAPGHDSLARLTLKDAAALARLEAWLPAARRSRGLGGETRQLLLWGGISLAAVVLLFILVIPRSADFLAASLPDKWEAALGSRVRESVMQLLALGERDDPTSLACRDETANRTVQALAERLAAGSEDTPNVTVTLVRSRMVNALTLPGGQILVLGGLLDKAQDPDELAGILAHEIGHAVRRDPTRLAIRESALSALIGLMLGDVTGGTVLGGLGRMAIGAAYTREAEAAADDIGIVLLDRAGIDPGGLGRFMRRIEKMESDLERMAGFLSTHPPAAARARAAEGRATPARPALTEADWKRVKIACRNSTAAQAD